MPNIDWKALTGAKTFTEMTLAMMERLKAAKTRVTNLNIGGVARTVFIELPSQAFADLHDLVMRVTKQGFVQYATGKWLDLCASNVGVTRRAEQMALGLVTFKRNPAVQGNIRIPAGTICKTPTGSDGRELRFFVSSDAMIPAGDESVRAPVRAEMAGNAYSVGAGYITELVTAVNGVIEITNDEDWLTQEGADAEDDETLRSRCILRWHELSQGSTKYAYQSWALSVEGVREAHILDQHPRGQGTVDVVIVGTGGTPSETLVKEVQDLIETKRPVCSDVLVRAPSPRSVSIDADVFIHPSEGDEEAIKGDCAAVLDALFVENADHPEIKPFAIGEDVTMARVIHALMSIQNVYNVQLYAPNDDIAIESDGLAVKERVNVTVKRLEQL